MILSSGRNTLGIQGDIVGILNGFNTISATWLYAYQHIWLMASTKRPHSHLPIQAVNIIHSYVQKKTDTSVAWFLTTFNDG